MYTEEELLNEIRRIADGDIPPTSREMEEYGRFSTSTYGQRFDSWNSAVEKAGFEPGEVRNIPVTDLLTDLQNQADNSYAPVKQEYDGEYTTATFQRRFGSWWQAVVRAGLQPQIRNPLTPEAYDRFHEAALAQQNPLNKLIALLFQFTGLPRRFLAEFSESWINERAGDTIVTVPSTLTATENRWVFRLPSTWTYKNTKKETELPGLAQWYFDKHHSIDKTSSTCRDTVYRVAESASLSDIRPTVNREYVNCVPMVSPSDLRTTGGIQMARQEAPAKRIRRHLGINHTNSGADVEDFFLWLYVHEGFVHPDYDPPNVVLNPV